MLEGLILAFLRTGTAIALIPAFGHRSVPVQTKVGIAAVLAMVMSPIAAGNMQNIPAGVMPALIAATSEIAVGLVFGLVTMLIAMAAEWAGSIIGMQMGFGFVQILDPEQHQQIPMIGQLQGS